MAARRRVDVGSEGVRLGGLCRGTSCRVMALGALWQRELFWRLAWQYSGQVAGDCCPLPPLKSLFQIGHLPDPALSLLSQIQHIGSLYIYR